jgi:hypothetical protein
MSSTFSELAATSLIDALAAQPESDRFLITGVPGEDLADTFRAVLARASAKRTFISGPGAPSAELRVLESEDRAVIVPYLVQDPPPAKLRENRGSQGYASALRDHYNDAAADGERIILLVFDARPNETLTSTMNQVLGESALGLEQLLRVALAIPEGAPQGLVRVAAVLQALAPRKLHDTLTAEIVGLSAQAVSELAQLTTSEEVGTALHKLPWCLSDPKLFEHAGTAFRARLTKGMDHRERLEAWASDPSTDLDGEVRKAYSPAAAALVVGARTGPAIDWQRFTLEDLLTGEPIEPDDDLPEFTELPVTIAEASGWKLLNGGRTLAAKIPGPGCTLTFGLTRELVGKATIHVLGPDGSAPPYKAASIAKVTAEAGGGENPSVALLNLPQPRAGWSFLEVMLTKGTRIVKKPIASVKLAISIGPGAGPLVYETHGLVDFPAQAYTADEQVAFIGELGGEQVFADDPAEPPDAEFGELVETSAGVTVPAVQGDSGGDPADEPPTGSPEHLALEAWASRALAPGELRIALRERPGGAIVADIGPVSRPVGSSRALPDSRWALERYVIEHPESTCFRLDSSGSPGPDQQLEHALGKLQEPFDVFLAARRAFFAELSDLPVPSVLGADLTSSSLAQEYVDAYQALLDAVPDEEHSQLGYDRIVLTDAFLSDTGEVFIAPTSPLSVALHLALQLQVREWLKAEPADNFLAGDSALISAQYLVPHLRLHALPVTWLESGYAPYPWRRYLPLTERARQERPPWLSRYIARRVERFLDVHPSYADERRTIKLAFINPGPARHVKDALLQLVTAYLKRRSGDGLRALPAFELQLLSDEQLADGVLGSSLDVFMGFVPEDGQPTVEALEVMKRLSYTKGTTAGFLQDPKAFAHITFVEDFFRPGSELFEVSLEDHPSSLYASALATDAERLAEEEPAATRFLNTAWTGGQPAGRVGTIAVRTSEIVAAATGVPVKRGKVRAADVLVPDSQIPQLYDRAVWVVHIDRNVGLELFAPQDPASGAPYILDYTDQETPEPGIFDGITATSQVGPYRALIADVLETALDHPVPQLAAERLLRTLNMISGRWGLEMLRTSENVLRGRLATALAAQVLEHSEGLHADARTLNLVIALDELLRVSGGEGLALKQGWAAKLGVTGGGSDDLLILTVPLGAGRPQLSGRIVEVKYRSGAGASVEGAAKQLQLTHDILTRLLVGDGQPGRSFQGRHLAKLILRYASRHIAYGVLSGHPVTKSGTEALSRIAAGDYDLDLTIYRDGKELRGDYVSVEPDLNDGSLTPHTATAAGIEIGRIRIGGPVIAAMLQDGPPPDATGPSSQAPAPPTPDGGHTAPAAGPGGEHELAQETSEPDETATGEAPVGEPAQTGTAARSTAPGGAAEFGETSGARSSTHGASPSAYEPPPDRGTAGTIPRGRFDLPAEDLRALGGNLDDVLMSFGLPLQPVQSSDAVCGPNTIRFRVRMARGGTIAQVEARERDIMRELGLEKPLMIGQEAGFVTLDVPRADPVTVTFGDLAPELSSRPRARGELPVLFGVDLAGQPRVEDLAQLPHLLVAGSTGSGKSVFLSSLLASLSVLPPETVEIVLIDVKGLDFAPFAALPHLRQPPISSAATALAVLDELYHYERAKRHEILAGAGAQNILDYYTRLGEAGLSQIVIVIDEFSNLLGGDKATGSQLEDTIQLYAEIMRSFGIYLVVATQRPSADIVTGRIKANLPARCAFRLPTHSDSMTILGRKGAEQLLGKGDMLFYRDGAIDRLQAPLTLAQDVLGAAQPS